MGDETHASELTDAVREAVRRSGDVHEVFGHVEDFSEFFDQSGVEGSLNETEINSVLGIHLIEDADVLAKSSRNLILSFVNVDDAKAISKLVVTNIEDSLVENRELVRLGEEDHLLLIDGLNGINELFTEDKTKRRAVEPLKDASTGQHRDDNDEGDREVHREVLEINDVEDDVTDESRDDKRQTNDDNGYRSVVETRQAGALELQQEVSNSEEREHTQESDSIHSRQGDGVTIDDNNETRGEQEEDEDNPMIRSAELVLVEQELRQAAIQSHTTDQSVHTDIRRQYGARQDENSVYTDDDFQPISDRDARDLTQNQELVVRISGIRNGNQRGSQESQERVEHGDNSGHIAQSLGEDAIRLLLDVVRARFESGYSKKSSTESKEDIRRHTSHRRQSPVFLEHDRTVHRNRRDSDARNDHQRDQMHNEQNERDHRTLTNTENR